MSGPIDVVEGTNAMRNMAVLMRSFYAELVEQGFSASEALELTGRYVAGLAAGSQGG